MVKNCRKSGKADNDNRVMDSPGDPRFIFHVSASPSIFAPQFGQ